MKDYTFWREVSKSVREECWITADSLEKATELHNNGGADYEEVKEYSADIIDEGVEE